MSGGELGLWRVNCVLVFRRDLGSDLWSGEGDVGERLFAILIYVAIFTIASYNRGGKGSGFRRHVRGTGRSIRSIISSTGSRVRSGTSRIKRALSGTGDGVRGTGGGLSGTGES